MDPNMLAALAAMQQQQGGLPQQAPPIGMPDQQQQQQHYGQPPPPGGFGGASPLGGMGAAPPLGGAPPALAGPGTNSGNAPPYGVYIGNIDSNITNDQLRQVFSSCGEIMAANLAGSPENPTRFGFIDFATEEGRAKAVKYDGFLLADKKIKVSNSKNNIRADGRRPDGPPRSHQRHQQPQQAGIDPALVATMLAAVQSGQQLAPEQLALLAGAAGGAPAAPAPYGRGYGHHHHHHSHHQHHHHHHHHGHHHHQQHYGHHHHHGHHHHGGHHQYGGGGMGRGRGGHSRYPLVNEQPSEEVLQLRVAQKQQFLAIVEKEADKYERKVVKKKKSGGGGKGGDSGADSGSDSEPEDKKKRKEDVPVPAVAPEASSEVETKPTEEAAPAEEKKDDEEKKDE